MYAPQVTRGTELAVALDDVKAFLGVDFPDDDALITQHIRSAVAHYEGRGGILGIMIGEADVVQPFDGLSSCFPLSLGPIKPETVVVKSIDGAGAETTVDPASYGIEIDGGGRVFVKMKSGLALGGVSSVSAAYKAGWPPADVPADIKTAVSLRVQMMYDEAAKDSSEQLERIERNLIWNYRRDIV